jgi:hypothetical protein
MGAWTTKPAPAKETARDPLAAAAAEAKLGAEAKPAAEPKRADEARTEAKPAAAGAATPVTAADTSAAPGRYSFAGADGQLYVDPASVTIGRRGPGGVLFREGERVIPIEDVTAVHIAPASATGRGFIQICYAGGAQVKTSYWQASKHPDTIQFTQLQQTWFDSAKQWIEYYRTLARSTQQQQPS